MEMSEEKEEMITISREEYYELLSDRAWLLALENAGVDYWSGRDYAIDNYEPPEF